MRKAQLFMPIYSIIFAAAIISSLVLFKSIIQEGMTDTALKTDSLTLEACINLMSIFDEYDLTLNLTEESNINISSTIISIARQGRELTFKNDYGILNFFGLNKSSIKILKNGNEWVVK